MSLKQTAAIVAQAIPVAFLKALGIKVGTMKLSSDDSIRFDLEKAAAQGINRVKLTRTVTPGGQELLRITFVKIEEVDMLYDVPAANAETAIRAVLGIGA